MAVVRGSASGIMHPDDDDALIAVGDEEDDEFSLGNSPRPSPT